MKLYCPFCGHESDGLPSIPCANFPGSEDEWRDLQDHIFAAAGKYSQADRIAGKVRDLVDKYQETNGWARAIHELRAWHRDTIGSSLGLHEAYELIRHARPVKVGQR